VQGYSQEVEKEEDATGEEKKEETPKTIQVAQALCIFRLITANLLFFLSCSWFFEPLKENY